MHFKYKGGSVVRQTDWDWPIEHDLKNHNERAAMLRPIPFWWTTQADGPSDSDKTGKALSINVSSGGMLVLMEEAPEIERVLKVLVPTPNSVAGTPTLAEVRWTRKLPFGRANGKGPFFVGLKFLF
jgi:hypothetical protein